METLFSGPEFQQQVLTQLEVLKTHLISKTDPNAASHKWIPRKQVMEFLGYGSTQMAAFEKTDRIIVSKIGKRKFILRQSLEKLLDASIET